MYVSQLRFVVGLSLVTATLAAPSAFASPITATPGPILSNAEGKAIPDQYIVVLKDDPSINASSVAQAVGAQPKHLYTTVLNGFAAQLDAGQLNALRNNPNVAYLEQDQEVSLDATQPMDPNGDPWGLDRIDQRNLPLSRSYTYMASGSGVTAYVIDTGLQASHPDFGGRAANVYDAFGGNGNDCNGHGTHVGGTIGGATYGVAKSVNLRGVRVLNCSGSGTWSGVIAGMDYVRLNAQRPAVANMSLGGGYSASVNTAAANLSNSGVFVAVSAGNGYSANSCNASPASTPEAYTVAASDRTDTKASFSNIGSCVDIYAPGVAIKSAWINSSTNSISGTSMAAPHVAGVAALYKNFYGEASSATISAWLTNNATPNVIYGNPSGTVNRLLFVPALVRPSTPVPADYDGDGKDDLSVKTDSGEWLIDYASNGFGRWDWSAACYGGPDARPVPADYDGDGKADLSVKTDGGRWLINYANNGFGAWDWSTAGYGGPDARPVPADYDGDGKDDLSVKTDGGRWLIDHANNGFGSWNWSTAGYGGPDARPVPADYDGDSKVDLSVKTDGGRWLIDYANNGFGSWNWSAAGY
jgi:subtilisin family serine protease